MLFLQLNSLTILLFLSQNGDEAREEYQNSTNQGDISVTNNAANIVSTGNGFMNETLTSAYDFRKTPTKGSPTVLYPDQSEIIDKSTMSVNQLYTHAIAIKTKSQEPASIVRPPLRRANVFATEEELSFRREEEQNIKLVKQSKPKDHPYAVGLITYKGKEKVASCSGTLVSKNWVLTAAQCLHGCDSASVYAGLDTLKSGKLPENAQMIQSSRLFPHPDYVEAVAGADFDVGLIELKEGFNLTTHVQPISLSSDAWSHRGYKNCEATAYRRIQADEEGPKEYRKITQQLEAKKPCACSFSLEVVSQSPADKFICTRGLRDIGVCDGDTGSGLVCDGKVKAVASFYMVFWSENLCKLNAPLAKPWGRDCGRESTLSVFHDTCPYLSWINGHAKLFDKSDVTQCTTAGGNLCRLNLAELAVILITARLVF